MTSREDECNGDAHAWNQAMPASRKEELFVKRNEEVAVDAFQSLFTKESLEGVTSSFNMLSDSRNSQMMMQFLDYPGCVCGLLVYLSQA